MNVNLVLNRLARGGWNPEPVGKDTWHARCPVHGGPGLALVVRRGEDGSAAVWCRHLRSQGKSCPEAEIWRSLGLKPPQPEVADAAVGDGSAIRPMFEGEPPRPEVPGAMGEHQTIGQRSPNANGLSQEPIGPASAPPLGRPIAAGDDESPGPMKHDLARRCWTKPSRRLGQELPARSASEWIPR